MSRSGRWTWQPCRYECFSSRCGRSGDSSRNGLPGRVDGRRALTRRKLAGRHPGQETDRIAEAKWFATPLAASADRAENWDRLRLALSRLRGEVPERRWLPRHESINPGTSREAHGSIERPIGGNVDWTQRTRPVEQGLEVEDSTRACQAARPSRDVAAEVCANREQRREGNDHGDVERLQAREKLRRVWRHRGRTRASGSHMRRMLSRSTSSEAGRARRPPLKAEEGPQGPFEAGRTEVPRNHRETLVRWPGNVANPMVGCRVQQTCTMSSGANRRSREERQGRNESGEWQLRAEGENPRQQGGIPTREDVSRQLSRAREVARSGRRTAMSTEGQP
jgi:hypothetical protein